MSDTSSHLGRLRVVREAAESGVDVSKLAQRDRRALPPGYTSKAEESGLEADFDRVPGIPESPSFIETDSTTGTGGGPVIGTWRRRNG